MKQQQRAVGLTIGSGYVTVTEGGRVVVAKILGCEEEAGQERIYLDRLVHRSGEDELAGFAVAGAISTILTREVVANPADA